MPCKKWYKNTKNPKKSIALKKGTNRDRMQRKE